MVLVGPRRGNRREARFHYLEREVFLAAR